MSEAMKMLDPVRVACEVCLNEVPQSETKHAEAGDYVMYFCGLECYRIWREQGGEDS